MHMRTRTVACDLGAAWGDSREAIFETPMVRYAHFHHEAMAMHMRTRTVGCDLGAARGRPWEAMFATPMVRYAHFKKGARRCVRSTNAVPAHFEGLEPPSGGGAGVFINK